MDRNGVGSWLRVMNPVALRKESVDRNYQSNAVDQILPGVALRKESVDRNLEAVVVWVAVVVALRKESVDRNPQTHIFLCNLLVALRKESVDRNKALILADGLLRGSLSARRAWIEIVVEYKRAKEKAVALRKESVDRNSAKTIRRDIASMPVALRKESVDRNSWLSSL